MDFRAVQMEAEVPFTFGLPARYIAAPVTVVESLSSVLPVRLFRVTGHRNAGLPCWGAQMQMWPLFPVIRPANQFPQYRSQVNACGEGQ